MHLECMRFRHALYEIVADGSDEGGTSQQIVLFCERFWLVGVGGRGSGRRVTSGDKDLLPAQSEQSPCVKICRLWVRHFPCCTLFLIDCFGIIMIKMVLCDLYLKRFNLKKSSLFDTCLNTVWYKSCRRDHSVLEFESYSPLINW